MKKISVIGLLLCVMGLLPNVSSACQVNFSPERFETLSVNDIISVEVMLTKEHRQCPLSDDDVTVELSPKAKIVEQTGWKARGSKKVVNTFTIKILEAGSSTFRITRDCQKKGISEATLTLEAK